LSHLPMFPKIHDVRSRVIFFVLFSTFILLASWGPQTGVTLDSQASEAYEPCGRASAHIRRLNTRRALKTAGSAVAACGRIQEL